jgi:hypothetical protein
VRNFTDTRDLASMRLPSGFSFVHLSDHAQLITPEGEVIRFGEGYSVEEVEAVAFERAGEVVRASEPDMHELVSEALAATGWSEEKRESWLCDFLYAFCVECEETSRMDEEWRDGTDCEDEEWPGGWSS